MLPSINYDFYLNKLLISCLLIVSKISLGIRDVEYDNAEYVLYKH